MPGIAAPAGETATGTATFAAGWQAYREGCRRLLAHVCPDWPGSDGAFAEVGHGYLVKADAASGAAKHVLALYDHLRAERPAAPLFERYAAEPVMPPEACLPAGSGFALRLGHASDAYPLAPAQRDALTHLLAARHGEILAVNGPPGTGKTTLVLSVVASLWTKAALDGGEPPVILAASTNNQAVTNIIDAFGKGFASGEGGLAGRWLPGVRSFGAYFPARARERRQDGAYQTRSFFEEVESEVYLDRAEQHYLDRAGRAFPDLHPRSVGAAVDALRRGMGAEAARLASIEEAWTRLVTARDALRAELGDDPAAEQARRERDAADLEDERRAGAALAADWERHRAREPLFYPLLAWLPPVAAKRLRLARLFLRERWPEGVGGEGLDSLDRIGAAIDARARAAEGRSDEARRERDRGAGALRAEQAARDAWRTVIAALERDGDPAELGITDVDERADGLIRFPLFLLATHYWEGRWLLDMQALRPQLSKEQGRTGRNAAEKRWRRRMMLTPCVVSTFFMLPSEMRVARYRDGAFNDDYLYDFADLLIVDEAGQALPDVAGASFALAKRALVIGDTAQIEPIWSIPGPVDHGNLIGAGLAERDGGRAFRRLSELGKTVSAGSVMRIAQQAGRYHAEPALERGLYLLEHRRCFDEIIRYCNALCYQGKLIPRRGAKPATGDGADGLPAMGYLHVDGICRQSPGGSRHNPPEAEAIARWLAARKAALERRYGAPLHAIVGVVTPFGAQVRAIARECGKLDIAAGGDAGEMTVGTVHALQGAERPVVIFSGVYSKHADGGFIDRSGSMLNVAVSRARNSFLLFGDMDVLEVAPASSPRGRLAALLRADDGNALPAEPAPRADLATPSTGLVQLRDAAAHDAFLAQVLAAARREIHIVTPWIRRECVEETGAMDAMAAAAARGVKVFVYSDEGSNVRDPDVGSMRRKRAAFYDALNALERRGVAAVPVRKVHSKVVIGDDNTYCIGSFNWFSARRDAPGSRHETSLAYRGPALANEIEAMKESLRRRAIAG